MRGRRVTHRIFRASESVSTGRERVRGLYLDLLLRRRPITESLERVSTTLGVISSVRHVNSRTTSVTSLSLCITGGAATVPRAVARVTRSAIHVMARDISTFMGDSLRLYEGIVSESSIISSTFGRVGRGLTSVVCKKGLSIGAKLSLLVATGCFRHVNSRTIGVTR